MGGMLGTAGGVNGTGISGPGQADIMNGVSAEDVRNAGIGAQQGIQSQQDLVNALQAQKGIANQSDVFGQTQNLTNQLARTSSVYNQNQALNNQNALAGQQQGLANQYQNIANGQGPNPAQNMLNQSTGQNVANQAALMAGQRGAGANVGLMARQAGQAGAGIQQNAVGQAATMQSQQQLNALSGLGAQQQAMGNTYNNVAGIAGQQIGAQQAGQAALAGQAAQQVNQQMGATTGYSQGLQNEQAQTLGALGAQNSAKVGAQSSMNSANSSMANTEMGNQGSMVGGVGKAVGVIGGLLANGGEVQKMAAGGMPAPIIQGPSSSFGQFLSGWTGAGQPVNSMGSDLNYMGTGTSKGAKDLEEGLGAAGTGIKKYMDKPGEATSSGGFAQIPLEGPQMEGAAPQGQMGYMAPEGPSMASGGLASGGGKVNAKSPDQKAVKKGNSFDNDKVPAMLSEGEVVIPRTVMQSGDPVRGAADFVAKVMAKRRK